jgi:hypothetical protein
MFWNPDRAGTLPRAIGGRGKLQRVRVRPRYESGALLRPRSATSRVHLIGHVARTQLIYARAHAAGLLKGLKGRE